MNFDKLLEPYREGGREGKPMRRTMGTIIDYLHNKKGYDLEIVGGAIFIVFAWMVSGGRFEGDGSYGSPGAELVSAIRIKCDELQKQKNKAKVWEAVAIAFFKKLPYYTTPVWRRRFLIWWRGKDVFA